MNFFEAQATARRATTRLVLLFILAIVILLAISNFIVFEYLYFVEHGTLTFSWSQLKTIFDFNISALISTAIIGFICLGSLYKLAQLSSGGSAVAQSLGGIIVPRSSNNPLHKKILNVVEEMAIASGTPVPQVYILNEQGINAFAAGWKTTNAVIGITQGALEKLSRDELQGVIAHEFSHIFNGDMRLNIRLIAILHGVLMIGLFGRMLLRSMIHSRSSRNSKNGQAVLLALGVGMAFTVIGFSGTFIGNWIKSLISRQREFLADASAVQFTRSSEGIANALKKIGGGVSGSALQTATADEYSHAYFALGDTRVSLFSFATHPALKERIFRIQPIWDGKYIVEDKRAADAVSDDNADKDEEERRRREQAVLTTVGGSIGMSVALNDVMSALDNIGVVSEQQIDAAHLWHQQLPRLVEENAENPYGAQALIFALMLHEDAIIENQQFSVLIDTIGEEHTHTVRRVQQAVEGLVRTQTLSLIDLTLPTLREMTLGQYRQFESCMQKLILADGEIELREWVVQRLVLQHLDEQYGLRKKPIAKYVVLGSAKYASELMLSLLAYLEHSDDDDVKQAFDSAKRSVGAVALTLLPKADVSLEHLNVAIDELELLKPPIKKRFLQACVNCISHDGKVTVQAYELTRAIASCLDCPMPPVMVNRQQ